MFESQKLPKALDETVFDRWLENGRSSKIGYHYLLVMWDAFDSEFQPVYVENRKDIEQYRTENARETFIAAYDLYSESRVL